MYPYLIWTQEYLGNLNFSGLHNFINASFFFQAIYNIQYPLRFYYSIYEYVFLIKYFDALKEYKIQYIWTQLYIQLKLM